ncbi:hypothetical protein ACMC5R_11560 [Deferribacteres bacterium DY0037]|nr:hypothetical protein [Denitrovibrio acetiphilus]
MSEESFYRRELGFYMLQTSTNFNNDYVKTADTDYTTESFSYGG